MTVINRSFFNENDTILIFPRLFIKFHTTQSFILFVESLRTGMDICFNKACDDSTFITEENLKQVAIACESITRTLVAVGQDIGAEDDIICIPSK